MEGTHTVSHKATKERQLKIVQVYTSIVEMLAAFN